MKRVPKLYILVGPPSSGKSQLAASLNGEIITGDFADDGVIKKAMKLLSGGTNAILDLDYISKTERHKIYGACPDGVNKTLMIFLTSLHECLERDSRKEHPLGEEEVVRRYLEFEEDCASVREEGVDRLFFVAAENEK